MTSFYYTLNSDGSRNIHPNNHGGDFTVQLHNTLDLAGAWEVALTEMTYFGQYFANILDDYGKVIISSTKSKVYPTSFVVDYLDAKKLYIDINILIKLPNTWIHHERLRFKSPHQYSWKGIKQAINHYLPVKKIGHDFPVENKELVKILIPKDTRLRITVINDGLPLEVAFSPFLANLLSLKEASVKYLKKEQGRILKLDIKKPDDIIDESIILFTPDTGGDIWIQINDEEDNFIHIPKIYCSINLFNKLAFNEEFQFTVARAGDEWLMSVKYSGDKNYNARLRFSAAMQSALGVPHDTTVYCGVGASSTIHDLHPKLADELDNSFNEIEFKLNYNHYPTSKSLVDNLNKQCKEVMFKIAELQHSDQYFHIPIFVFDEISHLATYNAVDQFKVTLTNHMLRVLNLPHTNSSIAAITAINLPSAMRPFLHVHCDVIHAQLINDDEYPLLRVINNNAIQNEKVMVSFPQPHYYPLARRYINSIHIYITDHINSDILVFTHPISYLLHFRRCN